MPFTGYNRESVLLQQFGLPAFSRRVFAASQSLAGLGCFISRVFQGNGEAAPKKEQRLFALEAGHRIEYF